MDNTGVIDPLIQSIHTDDDEGIVRAQIDTGAWASVTDQKHMLHDYQEFSAKNPSPMTLLPCLDGSDTVPHGSGYLLVPTSTHPNAPSIPVLAFYHPNLRTTVIDERDFMKASAPLSDFTSTNLHENLDDGIWHYKCDHRLRTSQNVSVKGIVRHGKCYTLPFISPDLSPAHPAACPRTSRIAAIHSDPEFAEQCRLATLHNVVLYRRDAMSILEQELKTLPKMWHDIPFADIVERNIPIATIRAQTERLLWHQRLGHPSDHYLYNAHKHIKGVPKFKHSDPIIDTCPTCIRAKQRKEPSGHNSTRTATVKYQGLSIDFGFSGIRSKNEDRREDYEGFNGETSWILISDHFTQRLFGDTRISKASPIEWLDHFLREHKPDCSDKYVCLDQGGELYKNPEVYDLFIQHGYSIRPTGADASNQNAPVERAHLTVANAIRSLLLGADLGIKFWPYAFYHYLRIKNAIPSRDQEASPYELDTGQKEDFSNFRTFGCRVWVRPPGRRSAKFKPNSRKGIFLGYLPNTTKNILWYDPETNRVKLAKHARFDEGMNDLPITEVPPNVHHLQRSEFGQAFPAETEDTSGTEFACYLNPFSELMSKTVPVQCKQPDFGLVLAKDDLMNRAWVERIKPRSSFHKAFPAKNNKLRGSYLMRINDIDVFTVDDARKVLADLRAQNVDNVHLTFAREPHLDAARKRKVIREHNVHLPIDDSDEHTPDLTVDAIRAISSIRFPDYDFSPTSLPADHITLACHAIQAATTPEEHAIGRFTRRKLKKLQTWHLWQAGEFKQLDHFHNLQMFGKPIKRPPGAIVLRPHWQYHIKRDGTRRSRHCCDGSKRAAPILHGIAQTYSSSVDQPIQRLFFALAASNNYLVFGGDAQDAYAHSPSPETPTYLSLDDAYIEWYKERFGITLDRSLILPVLHAHQGHPEAGRMWEQHIDKILAHPDLNFRSTTHARNIYSTTFDGHHVILLRQVDDFAIACQNESTAKAICDIIGRHLQLPSESEVPFKYLGLLTEFNGVDISQTNEGIHLSCTSYIDRVLQSHRWDTPPATSTRFRKAPLPEDCLENLYKEPGFSDDTPEHAALVNEFGFAYRTLLGELLYAYVTCRLDVGYALVLLSKFSHAPGRLHFSLLKNCAKYLRDTRSWGLQFYRPKPRNDLDAHSFEYATVDTTLPSFPDATDPFQLLAYVDAAHANDLRTRRSTTGYVITIAGAAIAYRTKTQSITATSSTEAEFLAAVSAAKTVKYLRSVLHELGFTQPKPTPIYEDNASAINMINAPAPTERSRHIDIQHFAILDWKKAKQIILHHIPGSINPSDDLTKPVGWVLHARHARRNMGHVPPTYHTSPSGVDSVSESGEGIGLAVVDPSRV